MYLSADFLPQQGYDFVKHSHFVSTFLDKLFQNFRETAGASLGRWEWPPISATHTLSGGSSRVDIVGAPRKFPMGPAWHSSAGGKKSSKKGLGRGGDKRGGWRGILGGAIRLRAQQPSPHHQTFFIRQEKIQCSFVERQERGRVFEQGGFFTSSQTSAKLFFSIRRWGEKGSFFLDIFLFCVFEMKIRCWQLFGQVLRPENIVNHRGCY